MLSLAFAMRLLIAGVLGFSGIVKLGSAPSVAGAAEGLGVPRLLAGWISRLLAPLELLIALALLVRSTAYAAAVAALLLFAAFSVLIAWNLARGRRPPCACFGEARPAAISGSTLARDAALGLLALLVVLGGPSAVGPGALGAATALVDLAGLRVALGAILLAVLLQTLLLAALLARRPAAQRDEPRAAPVPVPGPAEPAGWAPGTLAPRFELPSLDGGSVSLGSLLQPGRDLVLVFSDPDCRPCRALLPEIGRWQEDLADAVTIALVVEGGAAKNRERAEEFRLRTVLLQARREVAQAYRCESTPTAVAIAHDGRIATRAARGGGAIRELVAAVAEMRRDAPDSVPTAPMAVAPVAHGDPAPPFRLPAVAGGELDLFELAGRVAVLVFWSPTCPACKRLLPSLLEWERAQSAESAPLAVIATGSRAANSLLGFRSPVLLDESGLVSRAYGGARTPSAVMLDADGRVASGLALGASAILALLQRADALARAARRLALAEPVA